ncbi:two-component sensor [Pseudomonas aeruginosa]|nr:two-component sensor [Pseudomonas aeruginosa]
MLTSFSLTQLILISVAYLSTLFGIAWITERGYVPRRLVRHPLVYTLSLASTPVPGRFYGTVGLAYQYGYGFLAIYLGIPGPSCSPRCCSIRSCG